MKIATALVAVALAAGGIFGAYSYGRDYELHRGFSTLVQLPRAGAGRLLSVDFYSKALRRRADYLVYKPPRYSPRRRYPVYYLLHGTPGQPRVFVDIANMDVRLDNQLSLGHARPMILVYPDGRIGGSVFSDSEWANTPSGDFESYVIEVMRDVDHRFATLARRQDRVIAGFSAGAYGAINIALHHPAAFANVQTWSAYFTQGRTGVFAHASRAALAYNSPLDYATRLRHALAAHPMRVYMFVGRDDSAARMQPPMIRALRSDGAQVRYDLYAGGHDWSVWYPRLNQMLDLASADTARPLPRRTSAVAPSPPAYAIPAPLHVAVRHGRHQPSELRLLWALLLALISAALINIGFVLQHRGHSRARTSGRDGLLAGFRERSWLIGQAVGWTGFLGQIVAVALAPLTLVQAFSAGSLALSVPLAARMFGHRVRRDQLVAIAIIAISLVSLPIGFASGHRHLHAGLLIAVAMLTLLAGALLAPATGTAARALLAGTLYGAADAAIKAGAVTLRVPGGQGLLFGWALLAGLCTFGGFLCFQAALCDEDTVRPLSLMNAFTAVTAAGLGVIAFGERMGTSPAASVAHVIAIALVLACVRPLARAQQGLVRTAATPNWSGPEGPGEADPQRVLPRQSLRRAAFARARSALRIAGASMFAALTLLVCAVIAAGLLYTLRELHWFAIGPSVPDALPLLQLAGFAGQPLVRVLIASAAAGLVLGAGLGHLSRSRRLVLVGILGPLVMVLASDASYALARNLRFDQVLLNRAPGPGPWVEALLLAAGAAVAWQRSDHRLRAPFRHLRDRVRARQGRVLHGGSILADGRLVVTPLLALGFTVAVLGALVLPHGHAHAQAKGARPAPATASRAGRLLIVHFYSRALRRRTDYLVYLPTDYNPAQRVPAFYMLHGMPGRPLAFTVNADVEPKLEKLIQEHRVKPMILVFPDGRIDGNTQTDSEWANTRSGRYESYVVDVVYDVDHRFATLPYQRDRAIAGLSAGAYGAANVGLHQVALFGLIQVWSGYFIQTRSGVFAHATPAQLAYNSPLDYVHRMRRALERHRLRVFLYVGRDDRDRDQILAMAAALKAEGAEVHYAIYSGGHSWKLWSPRTDQMLIMASRDFAPAPRSSRSRGPRARVRP